MSLGRRICAGLDERLGLAALVDVLRHKSVPRHRHSIWYILGGMALTLMVIQVVTGVLLMLYYRPTTDAAHDSIRRIMIDIPSGGIIRSVHSWGSSLLIAVLFVHAISTLLLAAYRRPRELTWITGVLLLGIALAFGFSGYLLPWNERAYFATRVGTDLAGDVPLIGGWLLGLLRGGGEVGQDTLNRFFALHVAILPLATFVLLGIHLWQVHRLGVSTPPSIPKTPSRSPLPFFPTFILREFAIGLVVLGLLLTLAMFRPAEIGAQADALRPAPEGIAPEWFFLSLFQTLKMLPERVFGVPQSTVMVCLALLAGGAFMIVPLFDRHDQAGRLRRCIRVTVVLTAAYTFATTACAVLHLADTRSGISGPANYRSSAMWIGYGVVVSLLIVTAMAVLLLESHSGRLPGPGRTDN